MPKTPSSDLDVMISQLKAVENLSDLIAATDLDHLGSELAKKLHEVLDARIVILIACRAVAEMKDVVYTYPTEQGPFFSAEECARFCFSSDSETMTDSVAALPDEHPMRTSLLQAGAKSWLRFPLHAGGVLVGIILLLDLPKSDQADGVMKILAVLSPSLALALRSIVVHQQIEIQAEVALHKSEERFSKAFRANPAPLAISEVDTGQFIDVNEECLRMLNYTREEMVGHTSWELGVWVDSNARNRALAKLLESGSLRNEPVQFRIKHGEIRDVLWSVETITLDGKDVLLSLLIDVTARERIEKALRESEERFSKAFASNPAPLAISEIDTGRFIDVNDECLRMHRYTREEMVGHTSWELGVWVDSNARNRALTKLRENGSLRNEPVQFRIKHGEIRDVLWSVESITVDGKDVLLSLLIDVTARERTEKALRESEERFSKAFASNPAPLLISEIDTGKFIDVNRKWTQMLGFTREEMVGHTSKDLGIWVDTDSREQAVAKLRTAGRFEDEPTLFLSKSGEIRNALWSAEIITLNGKNVMLSLMLDYTERKRTEEALLESEERFSKAFASNPASLVITEIDTGMFVDVNEKWANMLGYTRQEMVGSTSWELGIWADAEMREMAVKKLQTAGRFKDEPVRFLTKSGEIRNVLWSAEIITLNGRNVMLSLLLDYTERQQAEVAAQESEVKYRSLMANLSSGVVVYGLNLEIVFANTMASNLFGLSSEQMQGETGSGSDWFFVREDGTRLPVDEYPSKQVLSSGKTLKNLTLGVCRTTDAKPLWELCNVYPVCDAGGRMVQIIATFSDITERKRAEEALRESEERFSKAFNANPASLVISEIDTGIFIDVNDKWTHMLGYTRREMLGRTSNELGIWADKDTRDNAMIKLRTDGCLKNEPVRFLTKFGEIRNTLWSAEVILLNGKNVMLSLILDYTERKRAEDALEKRIIALTQPFEETGDISFEDLFDLGEIQRLQDAFSKATGVASIITRTDGTPITKPSNFCRLCTDIIRKTERGLANCEQSNARIECYSQDGAIMHLCLSGGLWDAGASITVGGRHIASWLIGQVRDITQTEEDARAYAREIGADEQLYLEAYREVPILSRDRFEQISQSLYTLAKQISTTAYQNVQQARFISDRKRAEDALRIIAESGVAPGEDIFRSLVKQLAVSEGKRHALLARIDESDLTMAHTVAVWSHGRFVDNFSYVLEGTPCRDAAAQGACFYPRDVRKHFPQNRLFVDLGVESYWGVPLRAMDGSVMGLLAVLDDRPMEENPQTFSLLNSFAVRAASEMERRKIEAKYQTLFNEMLDGFAAHEIICDEAGIPIDYRYLTVNPAFERMVGLSADRIIGKTMREVLPQAENLWVECFGRVALTGEPAHFENYSQALDSYYEVTVFQPQPRQFACIVKDVTKRKQAEMGRQAMEQRYHTLVDNLPIGVFRNTPEPGGRFLMVNAAMVKICGYSSAEELLNTNVANLYVEPGQRRLFSEELLAKGIITAREVVLQRADGSCFWAVISSQVFFGLSGDLECFDGSILDITERKKTEEALQENERRLSYALSATSDAVWEWNCVTQAVYYSPRWYEMLGYDPHEYTMNFATWEALCHPDDFPHTVERIHSVLEYQKEQGYETEFRMRHKNGSWIWIRGRGNVVERSVDGEPLLLSGTNTDITERKRAEEDRERLEGQLRQAQKMEAVGQLAGGVAHDFNNLLQVILGHLDLIPGEDGGDSEEVHTVRLAAERAADLTRQLLAFSRRQIIQPVNLDLNDLVEGVLKMIRRVIGENIELRFLSGSRLGTIHADRGQFEQVLMNLCVNARDAMPNGGTLTIETENVIIGDEYCREHLWATEGRYVLMSVTDTGHGMDEATRSQIFEPFFTTKCLGQGTGLGLATVHGIVKQHNGLLYVYSEVGKGTAFKIYIPIVERQAEVVGTKVESSVVGGTETILVAEDEEGVRNLVCRMLQSSGYTVLAACDGEDALRIFDEHADAIDMALLDVMMPKLGGRAVMEYISTRNARIRFLFSSGYSENAVHTNFVMKEGIHLITKPYRKPDLLRAVRKTLDDDA